jgi:hypothetical protein
VISRTLDFQPADGGPRQPVDILIGAPERDPLGPDWRVLVVIDGAGGRKEQHVFGVDGVQTIVEALFLLPTLLSTALPRGRLTWLDEDDLGFAHRPVDPRS